MAPTLAGDSSSNGGGGKFRRRISRKSTQTTPYDRPRAATRNPSWLSKLVVDPASKLLNFGARRFFASVFPNKRLPTPPIAPPSEEEQERTNGLQETTLHSKIEDGVQEPVADVCGTSTSNNDTSGLSELEQLLKQKTFTRSEIDRLTGLLKSRSIDLPVKDDRHGFELNPSVQDSGRHQEFPMPSIINKNESLGAHGSVLDNTVATGEQNMKHFEDQIASPSQLAKAYMSNRPATLSPSTLGLRPQIAWGDSVPPSNSPYTSKSRLSPLPMKTSGYPGVIDNGFTTPRSRGRSAIYNMARTPYSRFNPVTLQKVGGSINYADSRPQLLASRPALENGGQVTSKPTALKRRSTVLDDDIGSIGPIRRIRQKHNLLPHGKSVAISGKGLGSDFTHTSKRPFMGNADTRGASTSSASYSHVPRESTEMAAKILEHLDKMTPKEKSLESKLAAAREKSPNKLSPHMLHGQALRSMEDLDTSKLLTNSHKDLKSVDQAVSHLHDSHEFTNQKQASMEEQTPVKSVHPEDKLTPARISHASNNSRLGNGSMPSFSSQPLEKKRPFKMSAHEDWIEMDDDCCNGQKELESAKCLEQALRDGESALNEDKTVDKSPVSLEGTPATPLFTTELEGGNVMAGEKNTGFNFSTSFAPNTSSKKVFSQSTKVGDSLFSSGTATTRNNPTSVESKVETSSSLKNVFSGTTNAVPRVTESDTIDKKNPELDSTVNGNLGKPPSLAFNLTPTNNITSVDAHSSKLAFNDGPLTSSASLSFTSSAPASVTFENQSFTNNLSNMASSAGATTSTSAPSDSVPVPANGASSSFSQSVSDNSFSKKLFSPPSKTGSEEATDVKIEKVNGFGNFSNSSTVSTFSGTSNGSSIFGVGTSSSSIVNSQSPTSASGTSDGKGSTFTGSGSANVTLSMPVHFGSTSPSMGFGSFGVTPLTSSSVSGASVTTSKSEGTTQSSAPASNPVESSNGAAPVTFNFGGGASASSQSNAFSSTTTSSLGTFKFGATPATFTSSNSSPSPSSFSFNAGSSASPSAISTGPASSGVFSFGAGSSSSAISTSPASAGLFNFGAGSSSSATSVSNTTGVFNFGAGTSVSSSSANPVTSSSSAAPAIFSFGASAPTPSPDSGGASSGSFASSVQAPKSTFGSPFSMPSSSTGFSFGGSSPAFGTPNSSMVFGSTTGVPSSPTFAFSTAASSPLPAAGTQSVFGNSVSPFTTTAGNNNQMSSEDCMAEDPIQSAPAAPVFGQPFTSPSPPGFMFGSNAPSLVAPFQFAGQQNQVVQQNPSPFQASGSLEFNAGGSFSLGSGGGDKSGRKIVKVNRNRNRKGR